MNINKYLNMTCSWESAKTEDTPYGGEYEPPVNIKCLYYSANDYFTSYFKISEDIINKSNRIYMVNELSVKKGDRIDGMIVVNIAEIPNRKGQIILKICAVR